MRWKLVLVGMCLGFLGLEERARAQEADATGNGGLLCEVSGNDVRLSWNIQFFAPIEAWIVWRDGQRIAHLEPEASSYVDRGVSDGEHVYELGAINADLLGGVDTGNEPGRIARCVVVVGDFGVRCEVKERTVKLSWGPILIDVLIESFVVRRDGRVIATLPPDAREYLDTVPGPGVYRYTVHAVSSPGYGFLIGACTAHVPPHGFLCWVDPPRVHLDWSGVPLPAIAVRLIFVVVRNNEVIGQTEGTRFTDTPGAGEHHYQVYAILGGDPIPLPLPADAEQVDGVWRILVGECKVVMPGTQVPPPEDLTCVNLDLPSNVSLDAQDLLFENDILLVWQIPPFTDYDSVVISRNGVLLARIPGSQFYYVDRNVPVGTHVYTVVGVIRGQVSPPAKCEVSVPFPPLPPPRDLTCEFLAVDEPDPTSAVPDGFVLLNWVNGAAYEWVVIVRNGVQITRVPGNATSFRDTAPRPGLNTYSVFGVVGLRRSRAASCEVEVPVGIVPPPEDLLCIVGLPTDPLPEDPAAGVPEEIDDSEVPRAVVLLRWVNPVVYDRLLVSRNGIQIAVLPGTAQSYVDHPPFFAGKVTYAVVGVILNRRSEPATCEVDLGPVVPPPPRDFKCEVVAVSIEPEPGEPIDPATGDVVPLRVVVRLSWVNPVRYAALVIQRDGDLLVQLPGESTTFFDRTVGPGLHRYLLWGVDLDGNVSARVRCEVEVPPVPVPPVRELTCVVLHTASGEATALLRWHNPVAYERIWVVRDGELIATLAGDAERYQDPGLEPGVYAYEVIALVGNRQSVPAVCRVVVDGPPPRNLLYFSSGVFEPVDATNLEAEPTPVDIGGRITCLASNSHPVQAWSFGVSHDPTFLAVAEATIDGTDTAALNGGAGPSFLVLERHEQGVTMAVIVDQEDPTQTLPPANAHRLLRLRYEAGPEGEPSVRYPLNYSNSLGDPPVAVVFVVEGFEVRPRTVPGYVVLPDPVQLLYTRGDVNGDDVMDMTDAVVTLDWLFLGGPDLPCLDAADTNASFEVNIADPVYNLQFNFSGGPPPPAPFPDCGSGPLVLGCDEPLCP